MKHLPGPLLPEQKMEIWGNLGRFLADSGRFSGRGATLWSRNPLLLRTNTFTENHLMKIEWFITDVTGVGRGPKTEWNVKFWG